MKSCQIMSCHLRASERSRMYVCVRYDTYRLRTPSRTDTFRTRHGLVSATLAKPAYLLNPDLMISRRVPMGMSALRAPPCELTWVGVSGTVGRVPLRLFAPGLVSATVRASSSEASGTVIRVFGLVPVCFVYFPDETTPCACQISMPGEPVTLKFPDRVSFLESQGVFCHRGFASRRRSFPPLGIGDLDFYFPPPRGGVCNLDIED